MPALQMAPNVPVKMTIKFVDVYANDITKNSGKGYGSQVAVKGKVDGVDQTIYLKGFTNENLGQLQDVGVIAKQHYPHDPAEKYNVPVIGKHEVTLCLDQPAGQKWPKMKITGAPSHAAQYVEHTSGYLPGDENYETPKPNGKPVVADALPTKIDTAHWSAFNEVMTKYVPVAVKAGAVVNVDVNALTFQLFEARRTGR